MALAVAGLLTAAGCGEASTTAAGVSPAALAVAAPTSSPTSPTSVLSVAPPTTVAPATTTPPTTVALPHPVDAPVDVYGPEPEVVLGRLSAPTIGLDAVLREGIRLTTLDRGPGHWPGSALPGEVGNVVVGGHRVTHGGPFRHLDRLAPGDPVAFTTTDGTIWTYVVTGSEVVDPVEGIRIVAQTPERTATLFACHPPGSAAERIVVHLRLAAS